MSSSGVLNPRVQTLAKRLEKDILARGLGFGQRYLTSAEAGHLLGVSAATAHRAMAVLVDRNVVVRRRRSGTFIGPAVKGNRSTKMQSVYVLTVDSGAKDILPADVMIQEMHRVIPDVGVHFAFVPWQERVSFVKRLLDRPLHDGEVFGVVPVSCGRDVYRFLDEVDVPTAVVGSLFSADDRLGSVDMDQRKQAHLLIHHLAARGHRRLAVFHNKLDCAGDGQFQDGMNEALTEAGLPASAALPRFAPDIETLRHQIEELMDLEKPPTGVITQSVQMAHAVEETVASKWPALAERLEVVFRGAVMMSDAETPYVHDEPTMKFADRMTLLARILKHTHEDREWKADHVVLPGELYYPRDYQK